MSFSRLSAAALALAALALIAAGCGGGDDSTSSTSTASSAGQGGGGPSTVSGAENSELGTILVDSKGFTVYSFAKDQGTTSSCYGGCEEAWPPVIVEGEPSAGEGASSSELGTTERKDGSTQATYAGHPLYNFVEDKKAGEANGNGVTAFGAEWNALDESGAAPSGGGGETGGLGY
jgi:predicted lipoprotein with Yx(FWY)xxD motif